MKPESSIEFRKVSAAEARTLLEEHRETDLSIAAFARSKGIQPWTLYNARTAQVRRAARERQARFTEVQVADHSIGAPQVGQVIEIALPSGAILRVQRDFDEVALRRLLGVLGSC